MKNTIFVVLLHAIGYTMVFSQLKVASNGNVGVQSGDNVLHSPLVVGEHAGRADWVVSVLGTERPNGLNVTRSNVSSNFSQAILGAAPVTQMSKTMGVYGMSRAENPTGTGRAFGVLGYAANATDGYNYGVMGVLAGTQRGAAVVGLAGGLLDGYINGYYAGYFNGNVLINGNLTCGGLTTNSDIRYKQNVLSLGDVSTNMLFRKRNNVLDAILQMNPIQYNLKQVYFEPENDTTTLRQGFFNEKAQYFQKKHYGLIAQELQKLYPDLVYEDDNGYLSVNYIGIIPLLIQSIKELKNEVDALTAVSPIKQQSSQVAKSNQTGLSADTEQLSASLQQNSPNPFSQSTEIRYYLPEQIGTALLCIYDMSGKQLKQIVLSQRGEGAATIHGSEFSAGIYLYALIADGKEVDVKRMILTE